MISVVKKILFILVVSLFLFNSNILGQSLIEKYNNAQEQIQELTQKINNAQGQQKTLANAINLLDNKIALKQLEIRQTETVLETVRQEILNLDINLDQVSKLLLVRISESYKRSVVNPGWYLFSSEKLNEFLEEAKYLKEVQNNDRKILQELQSNKDIKETKKEQLNQLQNQLKIQNQELSSQKDSKQELLQITKNDEKNFQGLLSALQADLTSITNALAGGGIKIGPVTTNDVIAPVGSSGCSNGPHLHFEVFINAKAVQDLNTGKYWVQGTRVDPKPYLENGQYKKPVSNYPGNVSTWYGEQYSESLKEYFGDVLHTGIDIANAFNTPIYPMADGIAYFVSSTCDNVPPGGTSLGKGILVDHQNGLASLYWHIP